MHPKLIVEQKITAFVNKYAVYSATPDGSKAELKAFVQQKRFAFKEMVSFYLASVPRKCWMCMAVILSKTLTDS